MHTLYEYNTPVSTVVYNAMDVDLHKVSAKGYDRYLVGWVKVRNGCVTEIWSRGDEPLLFVVAYKYTPDNRLTVEQAKEVLFCIVKARDS